MYTNEQLAAMTVDQLKATVVELQGKELVQQTLNIKTTTTEMGSGLLGMASMAVIGMCDSSDHDYQLSSTEIDSFVSWFMKHASADIAGYMLNIKVGTQESKEYLYFDKIISFEVMPLTK